jgi:hypothetical protein
MFPALGKQRPRKRLSDAPSRDLWLRDRSSGDLAHDGFPHRCLSPSSQPQWQCPASGPGREPLSLRVCACEAQPRMPHPTGLGHPAPAKLSLCPTSVTPLEAPLIGQDGSDHKRGSGDGDKECDNFFVASLPAARPRLDRGSTRQSILFERLSRRRWMRGSSPRMTISAVILRCSPYLAASLEGWATSAGGRPSRRAQARVLRMTAEMRLRLPQGTPLNYFRFLRAA